jgi:8-oxo-dGTP diphosphatase
VWLGQEVQALPRRALERRVAASQLNSGKELAIEGPRVLVVAAALYDAQGRILIAQRPAGKHMAGQWEFPGGKVATGESEASALARELHEELGIRIQAAYAFMRVCHDYPDVSVEVSLWVIEHYTGTPQGLEGQRVAWRAPGELRQAGILEADRPFIEALEGRCAP